MKINSICDVEIKKVEMEGAKNAFKQITIGQKDGTPEYSFRVFTIKPRGYTPFHSHNYEHLNYIIEGKGFVKDENGELKKLGKGDFVLVESNEKHQYQNASQTEDFVLICAVRKEFE